MLPCIPTSGASQLFLVLSCEIVVLCIRQFDVIVLLPSKVPEMRFPLPLLAKTNRAHESSHSSDRHNAHLPLLQQTQACSGQNCRRPRVCRVGQTWLRVPKGSPRAASIAVPLKDAINVYSPIILVANRISYVPSSLSTTRPRISTRRTRRDYWAMQPSSAALGYVKAAQVAVDVRAPYTSSACPP